MTGSLPYPIGIPGIPCGAAERLRARFEVLDYGRIDYGSEAYPLVARV